MILDEVISELQDLWHAELTVGGRSYEGALVREGDLGTALTFSLQFN